ncbi:unnamed protein product [Rotaria sp. Silwood1]|nr:unnamed protein product [Rotaria sp. Silwood1]
MNIPSSTAYQAASDNVNVLTCAYHPTIVGDHKCYRCQKIICLQCYTPRGPGYGFCPQCHVAEKGCCVIL